MTDTISHDKSVEANVTEVLSPHSLFCADATSEKRLSSAPTSPRRSRPRKKAKPLAGDRFFKACSRAPLIIQAFVLVALSGLPFVVFLGLAYTKYANSVISTFGDEPTNEPLHVTYKQLSLWLSIVWAAFIIVFCLAHGFGHLSSRLCNLSVRSSKYAPLAQTMCLRLTMMAWVGAVHQATCLIFRYSEDEDITNNWTYTLREAFVSNAFTLV